MHGDIGKFLGKIERVKYGMVLRGDKGAGKSRLLFQFLDAFAEAGFNCSLFSLEILKQSDIITRYRDEYIKPRNFSRVQCADIAPGGIKIIRQAAAVFDVVAIDSFTKLKIPQSEFDQLMIDFPETMFIVIFQSTTAGTARGGSGAEFDCSAVLQVAVGGIASFEKNRYALQDYVDAEYDVFKQKLISKEETIVGLLRAKLSVDTGGEVTFNTFTVKL